MQIASCHWRNLLCNQFLASALTATSYLTRGILTHGYESKRVFARYCASDAFYSTCSAFITDDKPSTRFKLPALRYSIPLLGNEHDTNGLYKVFRCEWKRCAYRDYPTREELIRHIDQTHLSHVSLPCPIESELIRRLVLWDVYNTYHWIRV